MGAPRVCSLFLAAAAALLPQVVASAGETAGADFALRGCRVETVAGTPIEDGVVVVRRGRIEAVGPAASTQVPPDLTTHDATGKVLLPGFVFPATRVGLRGSGGGSSSTKDLKRSVADELTPWADANFYAAASGFTTLGLVPGNGIVGGRGLAVRAAPPDAQSAVLRDDALVRVTVGTGTRFASTLAGELKSARGDLDKLAKFDREHAKWKVAKAKAQAAKKPLPKEPKKPSVSADRESLRKVLRGEAALLAYVGSSAAVHALVEALADEAVRGPDLRLYAVCTGEAYRAAGALADLGAVCLVRGGTENRNNSTDIVCPALLYRRAGARVLLLPRSDSRNALRAFPLTLARTVRAGFPRAAALRSVTLAAAEMLGVADVTGSIEKGKRADLALYSGDPLRATSRIERVWIEGVRVEETP